MSHNLCYMNRRKSKFFYYFNFLSYALYYCCSSSTSHSHVHCNDEIVEDANARICHTSHTEPCSESMTGTMGLCTALLFHSAIEGLAIGVQNSPTKVGGTI